MAIPDCVAEGMKTMQFVGYAANPRVGTPLAGYNVCPYNLNSTKANTRNEASAQAESETTAPRLVPKFYRRVHVRPSRFASDDFDFRRYNKTELVALEAHPAFPVTAPTLMALFHLQVMRGIFVGHVCATEHCLACETGFLFRMLEDRTASHPALVNNFARSLRAMAEAAQFMPDENGEMELCQQTTSFIALLFERFKKELGFNLNWSEWNAEAVEAFEDATRLEIRLQSNCVRCSNIASGESHSSVIRLRYNAVTNMDLPLTFIGLLEKSLTASEVVEAHCERCDRATRTQQSRRVQRLPPVLVVDTAMGEAIARTFWTKQLSHFEKQRAHTPFAGGADRFQQACRYGEHCRKPFCKYSHNGDTRSMSVIGLRWDTTMSDGEEDDERSKSHYLPSVLFVKNANGICTFSPKAMDDAAQYILQCAIMGIADDASTNPSHLITLVRHSPVYAHALPDRFDLAPTHNPGGKHWVVLNEFVVTRVNEREAMHVDMHWKRPVMLFYVAADCNIVNGNTVRLAIPSSVFEMERNLAEIGEERGPFVVEDLPNAGELVAIDAEFVTLHKNEAQQMAVARVSCIRGSGERAGSVLMDDYIHTSGEMVHDYLTEFSGIRADDLDPVASTKHLTTLKNTFLKLLHLRERRCVFVGHGLSNDLRMLCLYVPAEQLRDTVHLFHLPQQRMISLQFLAWHLLGERIQAGSHDSVEDARTALRLHSKYEELRASGELSKTLQELYEDGKRLAWKIPEL